jgi:hypothetical protein
MLPAYRRTFLRVLLTVGISGLAAEMVFIGFNLLTRYKGNDTTNLMLAETAAVAVTYGAIFGLIVLGRKFPAWAFPPPNPHETLGKKGRRGRFVLPMALGISVVIALMEGVFLAIGWATAMDVMSALLHYYPIAGMLVAVGIATRGSSIAPSAPSAG